MELCTVNWMVSSGHSGYSTTMIGPATWPWYSGVVATHIRAMNMANRQADIWAVGALAYRLLTGVTLASADRNCGIHRYHKKARRLTVRKSLAIEWACLNYFMLKHTWFNEGSWMTMFFFFPHPCDLLMFFAVRCHPFFQWREASRCGSVCNGSGLRWPAALPSGNPWDDASWTGEISEEGCQGHGQKCCPQTHVPDRC